MNIQHSNIYLLLVTIAFLTLGSCSVSKYLEDDQYLIKKNKVIIKDKDFSSDDANLIYNLESFIIQKPNSDFAFIPREWIYFTRKEKYEAEGKKKGLTARAERPVLHDDEKMFQTAEQMEKYLRFSRGYYNARVHPKVYLTNKRSEVHYYVFTEKQYKVRSKEYFSEDERVLSIISQEEIDSHIQVGTGVDELNFDREKTRLVNAFQNRGFAKFSQSNIDFKADSSGLAMDIFVTILPPANDSLHRKYTVGKITVYPDYKGTINKEFGNVLTLEGIDYAFNNEDYYIKPKTLDRSIQFRENQFFKKSKLDDTYASLANLGTYRFINISSAVSPKADTIIDYNILLTPIDKTWSIDFHPDLFYSFILDNPLSRLGLSASTSLNNLNAFGGGEKFRLALEATGETILPDFDGSSFSLTAETGLTYPTFVDPFKLASKLIIKPLYGEEFLLQLSNKTTTDVSLGYKYDSQIFRYQLNSINAGFSFSYRPTSKFSYDWTRLYINSLSTTVEDAYRENILSRNKNLERSFEPRLITGFILHDFSYSYSTPVFASGFSGGLALTAEQSGIEIAGANQLYNWISGDPSVWAINLGPDNLFEFSKYLRLDGNVRAKQIISGKHEIAGRFRFGIAKPFTAEGVIPFTRQFYAGGANSMRAWATRDLGPGAYQDTSSIASIVPFQTGDMVLEANIEYRFPVYWIFEGAFFVDAGNIWTIDSEDTRENSQFQWNSFYNQIAVGYGAGIRINLDYLVIRFDFGYKLRYPYLPVVDNVEATSQWKVPDISLNPATTLDYLKSLNFSVGINYPF